MQERDNQMRSLKASNPPKPIDSSEQIETMKAEFDAKIKEASGGGFDLNSMEGEIHVSPNQKIISSPKLGQGFILGQKGIKADMKN